MRLGREYEDANLPLAVKRLSQAGMRLSEVLNECLSPEAKKAIPAPHFPKATATRPRSGTAGSGDPVILLV